MKAVVKKLKIDFMKTLFKIALLVCLPILLNAQQTRVDSAIAVLNKSNTAKGLDTLTFKKAQILIISSVLTDAQITQIEKSAGQFKNGIDVDLCFIIKGNILRSLSASDKFKAIDYGQRTLKILETSKTPESKFLYSAFLKLLRVPYRNSSRLIEGFPFYKNKLNQLKKANDSVGISACYYVLAGFYRTIGLYEPAIYHLKKSISYIDSSVTLQQPFSLGVYEGKEGWINNTGALAEYYLLKGDYEKAINYSSKALETNIFIDKNFKNQLFRAGNGFVFSLWGTAKIMSNQLDSLEYYFNFLDIVASGYEDKVMIAQTKALYKMQLGFFAEADSLLQYCRKLNKEYSMSSGTYSNIIQPDYYLALLRIKQQRLDEAAPLLLIDIDRVKTNRPNILRDYKLLIDIYQKIGKTEKANQAFQAYISLQDSLQADQEKYQTISFETEQVIADNEIAISKLEGENKLSAQSRNFTIGIATLLLILAGSIYYRFQSKKKANEVLEKTLTELKSTQSQLIQSEKMASLGELTAGIAHEIQNPLNFVNNFSEVSTELVKEMVDEVDKGNTEEVKAIANDVVQNLEKINHHGKRAADIVKGMLQHSSAGSGKKEPTNINALADEYLRLAYHGLRAKDKSFNATMKTDFDESIGMINIIPQDIGRVILNLITNAFYVVNEKAKAQNPSDQLKRSDGFLKQSDGMDIKPSTIFEPTVSVSTKKVDDKIEIKVTDNGAGIPPKIIDKIFQPFFTTKPTGQGTGLGLSLSYDIVKAHGGELKVETKPARARSDSGGRAGSDGEGQGSTFTILLPLNQ